MSSPSAILPKPKPWRGSEPENTRQTVLLAGMDCQPGQMDLLQTDGEGADSSTQPASVAKRN